MSKTIRIISPAGALDPQFIHGAADRLRAFGYEVEIAPHACGKWGRFSSTPDERISDAVAALTDPSVGVVLCSRGGYGLQQIIDRIDQGVRDKGYNGAAVWGFSDVTELHLLLAKYGAPSVHGIMCKPWATLDEDSTIIEIARAAMDGRRLSYSLGMHYLNRDGEAEGLLVGGNMAVLCGLIGTPYDLCRHIAQRARRRGRTILFLEDVGEPQYKLDRMLHQLRMNGVFEHINGLIIGRFAGCDDDPEMGKTLYESIARIVEDADYPVLFDFPAGHIEENAPLIFGTRTRLIIKQKAGRVTCSALPLGLEPRTP